jgi:GxxExxY protein
MPINHPTPLRCLSQDEFRELAFTVKGIVIDIHRDFGRFFDERVYKLELARRIPGVRLEVPVDVRHLDFTKRYFLDVLVGEGGLFEFKAAETFSPRHRAQLIHYLMLCGLEHGMLLTTRADRLETEFVNSFFPLQQRVKFQIDTLHWEATSPGATRLEEITRELLADWGAGLDVCLYQEAITHFLGGETEVVRPAQVTAAGVRLTEQKVRLVADGVAFKITAFDTIPKTFASHAQHFIEHTDLTAIQWINLNLHCVSFATIKL